MVKRSKRKLPANGATRFSARKKAKVDHETTLYGNDYGILPSVKASVIPGRVPLGFICGYPLAGGELYGGSMFLRSAAQDTLQGQAIGKINSTWGTDVLHRAGRETIGIPVCKKKYKPFQYTLHNNSIAVERLYACPCHSSLRKDTIEKHGVRKGWQPFGVWSLKKAKEQAKIVLNMKNEKVEETAQETNGATKKATKRTTQNTVLSNIGIHGECTWKVKSAYDDIYKEIHGYSESDSDD